MLSFIRIAEVIVSLQSDRTLTKTPVYILRELWLTVSVVLLFGYEVSPQGHVLKSFPLAGSVEM